MSVETKQYDNGFMSLVRDLVYAFSYSEIYSEKHDSSEVDKYDPVYLNKSMNSYTEKIKATSPVIDSHERPFSMLDESKFSRRSTRAIGDGSTTTMQQTLHRWPSIHDSSMSRKLEKTFSFKLDRSCSLPVKSESEPAEQPEPIQLGVFDGYFNKIKHKFSDIELNEHNAIPTFKFLKCNEELFGILDKFGSPVMAPVKSDVFGNINKLWRKYEQDPERFVTLQAIVQHEIDDEITEVRNSATDALMWLRRTLWFMSEYLSEYHAVYVRNSGRIDYHAPSDCLNKAYNSTMRQYHSWAVRGIFSLALKAIPSNDDFMLSLVDKKEDYLAAKDEFTKFVITIIKTNNDSLKHIIEIIKEFYIEKNLNI